MSKKGIEKIKTGEFNAWTSSRDDSGVETIILYTEGETKLQRVKVKNLGRDTEEVIEDKEIDEKDIENDR